LSRHRLVTVTGPGGSGKTRLAVQLARTLAPRFENGAWLVELAPLETPASIPAAVAATLGVREQPGRSMTESVTDAAGSRHLLMVLDNCEHVVEPAAELCHALLVAGDDLRVLATSREPLGIDGEARFPLPPLPLPAADEAGTATPCESVALFVERAAQLDPDFSLTPASAPVVAQIVRRLDGMPLAIELAAARVGALGPDELLSRLDDRFGVLVGSQRGLTPRQRSLQSTVEWSYDLLSEAEQEVFRAVSVFPAPFTLPAANAVAGGRASEYVPRLVDCSLLNAPIQGVDGRWRYATLETVRAYGYARLVQAGDQDSVWRAVTTWMLSQLSEPLVTTLPSTEDVEALRWMDADRDNIRWAIDWMVEHDAPSALSAALPYGAWCCSRGRYREGTEVLEAVLAVNAAPPSDQLAAAHYWLGQIAFASEGSQQALEHQTTALHLLESLAPSRRLVYSLLSRAGTLSSLGRNSEASAEVQRALEIARAQSDRPAEAYACLALAYGALNVDGDLPRACALIEEATTADPMTAQGLFGTGLSAQASLFLGDVDEAERLGFRGLDLARRIGDRPSELEYLTAAATAYAMVGRLEQAAQYLPLALNLALELGDLRELHVALAQTASLCLDNNDPEAAATILAARDATRRSPSGAVASREDWRPLHPGDVATSGLRERIGKSLPPAKLRSAERQGSTMTLPEVIELAHSILRGVGEGKPPAVARSSIQLSPRELELVSLVAAGLTDQQIGEKLFISIRTVRSHLDRIRDKTGCRRRADLTRLAVEHGLV
jgi:non-specific serine/threonine protein kinase